MDLIAGFLSQPLFLRNYQYQNALYLVEISRQHQMDDLHQYAGNEYVPNLLSRFHLQGEEQLYNLKALMDQYI